MKKIILFYLFLVPFLTIAQDGAIRKILTTTDELKINTALDFGGFRITGVVGGTTNNQYYVTKGYVDDLSFGGGSEGDTIWTRMNSRIYPRTLTDEVSIGSATDYGDYKLQMDGSTIYRLRSGSDFRSIDFITGTVTTPYYRIQADGTGGLVLSKYNGSTYDQLIRSPYSTNTIDFSGGISVSNTTSEYAGLIRWNGTRFQGYTGSTWVNLDEAGTTSGVTSFNSRTGVVVPVSGDYTYDMVTNAAGLTVSNLFTANQYVSKASPYFYAKNTTTSSGSGFVISDNNNLNLITFGFNSSDANAYIYSQYNYPLRVILNNAEQSRFNTNGVFELRNLSATPSTGQANFGGFYVKNNLPYFINSTGTEYSLTASGGGSSLWQEDGNYLKPLNTLRNVLITNTQPSLRFIDTDYSSRNYSVDFNTDQLRFSYFNGSTYSDNYINQYGFYGGQLRLYSNVAYENQDGVVRFDGTDLYGRVGGTWKSLTAAGGSSGTVTSVAAGNGMSFTTITTTGTVTMGTPSSITTSSTNSASSGTHTHVLDLSGRSVLTTNSLTGGGNLSASRTLQLVNDVTSPGNNKVYGTNSSGTRGWQQGENIGVQTPSSNTSYTLDATNGQNMKITLIGNTTVTMQNLVPGSTGNLTVYNASSTYTLTFSGSYSFLVSPIVRRTTASPNVSGNSKIDVFSWYYDGSDVFINGTLDYGTYYQ